jgi:hypothetical protein
MNFIKIFGFFIGLFITLFLISYVKINEPFTNIEHSSIEPLNYKTMIINDNDDSVLPYNGYKFMCINTYNDLNKIVINDGKWYDIDDNNLYFKFNKILTLDKNFINKKLGSPGANISHIQLNGPESFNFANNSETYEVIEFTMFMTIKIISCLNKNNILFEMTGNTTSIDKLIPTYTTSIININFVIREDNKNYDIILLVGDKVYSGLANNIDKDIVENTDYIIIGLYYKKDKIGLIFNNKIYEYENLNKYEITLGSTPLIINKNGSFNMHLYKFVYYKSLFDFQYYDYLGRYNNYYLSGLNNHETKCQVKEIEIKKEKEEVNFEKITLPEFKYPILHKYYDSYKNNFFDLFKKHNNDNDINNDINANVNVNVNVNNNNDGSFFDLLKRNVENNENNDVDGLFSSFNDSKYTHAKIDNSFI